jgi:squalene-associated FAD-dependent desaturase
MPERDIAIIGGGMAGLAAAATLTKEGCRVSVFESSRYLGGRARSFHHYNTLLDNGQHILLGAYHETLRLLKLAGLDTAKALHRLPLTLSITDLNAHNNFWMKTPSHLPAPLHILYALIGAKGISYKDKLCAIRFMSWMKFKRFKLARDETLINLLQRHYQSDRLIQYLWEPLCLGALNTPPVQASAQIFLNVLRDSFNQQKQDADLLLAKSDLSALISTPLANYIKCNGGSLYLSSPIKTISTVSKGFLVEQTHHNHPLQFSHVILACGPHQLKQFTNTLPSIGHLSNQFEYQAITTVYLQYPAHTELPLAMSGCVNSTSQWIFDRGQLCQQAGLIAVVISAHQPTHQTNEALADQVANELRILHPNLGNPIWCKVITEKRATFSANAHLNRPENSTKYPHLYLAGDYTASDYPATIEGAVRSGIAAAKLILNTT